MIRKSKRIMTAFLAVIMLISTLIPLSASAADVTMDLSKAEVSWDYTLTDEEENVFSAAYGLKAEDNPFGGAIVPMLRKMHDYTAKTPGLTGDKSDWVYGKDYVYCFCIEHGVPLPDSGSYSASSNATHGNKYEMLSEEQKALLHLALAYGYPNRTGLKTSADANACYSATQLIVWQITLGFRTSPTELNDKTYPVSGYSGTMTEQYTRNPYFKEYYDLILADMAAHYKRPSFTAAVPSAAKTYEMEYTGGQYTLTLTDANNVLSDFYVSASGGVNAKISGNTLTLTSSTPINSAVTLKLTRKMPSTNLTTAFLIWSVPGREEENQDMVSGVPLDNDPVPAYFKVMTAAGSVKIIKESEDGIVDGLRFRVQGNGVDQTVTTKNGGQIQIDDLRPGIYTITEQTEEKYEPQEVRRVTVVSGQVATVTFSNTLKRGDLTVTKTSEDGLTEGAKFHLYGTSLSGLAVDEYAVADRDGKAYFQDVLIGTNYVLEEVDVGIQYVVLEKQTADIEWNKVTEKTVDNILKKWQLTVTKSDAETGTAQGDASLAGAVYGIFKGDQLVDQYTTDANGQFTTEFYICDSDWSLRELSSSEGYLLNTESLHIGAEPKLYTVEYNQTVLDSLETVQKGKIAIIKHCDDGSTQIETPEIGAAFEVYLKAAGSYSNAKDSERDLLVCDENGFAQSKDLPYGIYTVKQTKGLEGNELLDEFDVYVSKDGEVYRYIINNAPFKSYIKVVKTDSTTGKVIPYAGAAFQLFRPDGSKVEMTYTYPAITTIDTFYTTADGTLITPEALEYGKGFSLVEVSAPYGYVLDPTPVYFDVTEDNVTEESAVTIIKVDKPNMPQMGTITIDKKGEVFASVENDGEKYIPVYKETGLAGAVYGIYAAEDIYTLDGTLRYSKGEKVATLTTSADGTVTSEPLFLGKFEIREEQAPYGTVLNTEPMYVELTYASENIEVTATTVSVINERQKAIINLLKKLETDDQYGIGLGSEYQNIKFGLYAAETLTAADGTEIPKDGLLDIIGIDESGLGVFSADIPVGAKLYVKEYATDSHYLLSDTQYPVEFNYTDSLIASVQIDVNNGEAIENVIIRGNIKGVKTDEENNTIAGAVFGLFKPDETDFTPENALATAVSDSEGLFAFDNVPYENWLIKELSCPEYLVLSDEPIPVTISEQDQLVELDVVNEIITGSVEGLKTDNEGTPIEGVVFGLFAPDTTEFTEENALALSESTAEGMFRFEDIRYGKYLIKELSCGEEFVMCEDVFEVDISENGQVVKITVINKRISGKVQVVKLNSKDHSEKLSGAVFELYLDVNKNGVFDVGTDTLYGKLSETEAGIYTLDGLGYNGYFLFESAAPEGFQKDDRYFYFKIKTDYELITIENESGVGFVNEPVPESPDSPQTGDNSNIWLWFLIACGSLGILITILFINKKKHITE